MTCPAICCAKHWLSGEMLSKITILSPTQLLTRCLPSSSPNLTFFVDLRFDYIKSPPLPNWTLLWKTLTMDRDKDPLPPRMWDLTRQGPVWSWPPSSLYMRPHGRVPPFVPLVSLETCSNLFTSGHPPTSADIWCLLKHVRLAHAGGAHPSGMLSFW